jgi:hypothetical protein
LDTPPCVLEAPPGVCVKRGRRIQDAPDAPSSFSSSEKRRSGTPVNLRRHVGAASRGQRTQSSYPTYLTTATTRTSNLYMDEFRHSEFISVRVC